MNTSSIIILFSIRKIYYILRRKSSIFMSRFFYFGGYIIRGGGGYRIFFCPKAQSNSPSRKGGVLLRSAFSRGATKGVGGRSAQFTFISLFLWGISGQRKRIVGSEISHFRAMILLLNDYLKILKWYQTRLEEGFWTLQSKVRLLGLLQFQFLYKLEFHFQIPHFIFENRPGSWD